MNRLSKVFVICGALLVWYALFGFLIAPALVQYFGQKQLQEHFSPDSGIDKVRMNPFTGSVRVEGLAMMDPAGAWSVAWQAAELNLSAATVLKFYPVVDALRLQGADLRYEKRAVDPDAVVAEAAPATVDAASGDWRDAVNALNLAEIPELRIDLLEVTAGRAEFVDLTAAAPYKKMIDPIDFTLRDLTTVVDGDADSMMRFVAETDEGATLTWEGDFSSQPIRSAGSFSLKGLAVHELSPYYTQFIRFNLKRAVFGLGFDYQVDLSNLEHLLQIENGHLALTEVLCEPIDQDGQLISIDAMTVDGLGFSFPEMSLGIDRIAIATGETRILRDAAGQINLAQLIALPPAPAAPASADAPAVVAPKAPKSAQASEAALPALTYEVATFELQDYRIVWEDALAQGEANLTVEIPQMTLTGLSSDLSAPFQLDANYLIGDSGQAHIAGSVVPAETELDLSIQLQGVPLQLLSPYTQNFASTQIERGTFDLDGRFQYAEAGAQTLTGNASILGIDFVFDQNLQAKWQRLRLTDLHLDLAPFSLAIDSVVLDQPEIVYTQQATAASDETAELASDAPSEEVATAESEAAMPISIGTVSISQGSVVYVDQSMEPAPKISMDTLGLMLRGLDLAGSEPAELGLSTKINGSPFTLSGTIHFNQLKAATRLQASLTGLSLPAFSTYSGQAVGRRIASGHFNLESDWVIEDSQLQASNKIRIEQLKFGDKVDSEGALRLPLDLAVTLLKGPNGVMDLSLPLKGDLNDPKVGVGQIVRTAIVGLITNVAAAPFKLLSGLVGADEDLSVVDFAANSAELSPAMVDRLNSLAAALKERPGLILAMTPLVSQADETSLAEAKLRSHLMAGSDLNDAAMYHRQLTQAYGEAMKVAAASGVVASATPDSSVEPSQETMVAALLPSIQISDTDISTLAAQRAAVIREHLITAQGIAADRLSVGEAVVGASESQVKFDLK
jgi:hypothetical protein